MSRRKLELEGKEVWGEDEPFRIVQDATVVLELEDGARLRLRPVIVNVIRTDEKNPEGERFYAVQSFMHLSVEKPAKGDEE